MGRRESGTEVSFLVELSARTKRGKSRPHGETGMSTARETDLGVGLGMAFGLVSLAGAGYMIAAPSQTATAWGFAAAVTAGVLAVGALHAYGA
jgi:hypothetical protein